MWMVQSHRYILVVLGNVGVIVEAPSFDWDYEAFPVRRMEAAFVEPGMQNHNYNAWSDHYDGKNENAQHAPKFFSY